MTSALKGILSLTLLCGGLDPALAELSQAEVDKLSPAAREPWREYLERSKAAAAMNAAALAAEVEACGQSTAIKPSSGPDFKLRHAPGDRYFASEEAIELAEVILSYQTPAGGWSKHLDYAAGPRRAGVQWSAQFDPGRRPHYLGTFDNHATTAEIQFLCEAWKATRRDEFLQGVRRGVRYVLEAQNPHGGWPQVYPLEGGYHDAVTLNDDAMTHVLELLNDLCEAEKGLLDHAMKEEIAAALKRGIDCVVKMQVDGRGWCGQHDAITLEPVAARAMEPAALVSVESANLLKFLMKVREPKPEWTQCIQSGLKWLEAVALPQGDDGKMRWARFYDLNNDRAIYPGRDGKIYPSLHALAQHNPVGYAYESSRPESVVTTAQESWRKSQRIRD